MKYLARFSICCTFYFFVVFSSFTVFYDSRLIPVVRKYIEDNSDSNTYFFILDCRCLVSRWHDNKMFHHQLCFLVTVEVATVT